MTSSNLSPNTTVLNFSFRQANYWNVSLTGHDHLLTSHFQFIIVLK